jgi:hypothetical protein
MNFEIADAKWRVTVNQVTFRQRQLATWCGRVRSMREINRKFVTTRKPENTCDVIAMLVRNQNTGKRIRRNPEPGKLLCRRPRRKTAIQQNSGIAGFDNQGITPTAAAKRCKTHHFNWS